MILKSTSCTRHNNPSMSKKKRGKAQRKAKAAVAAEQEASLLESQVSELKIDDSLAAAAVKSEQEVSLETQVAKLNRAAKPAAQDPPYDEDAFLEEARKLAVAEEKAQWINGCDHSYGSSLTRIHAFTRAFTSAFIGEANRTSVLESAIRAAHGSTARRYEDVMFDLKNLELVVSVFVSKATEVLLRDKAGDTETQCRARAGLYASLACYFEHHIKGGLPIRNIQAFVTTTQMFELHNADNNDRVLIGYLKRRLSCSCLNDLYNEVKSTRKLGICFNEKCPLVGRKAERSKMFYCSRCGLYCYCSRECQAADWPNHMGYCNSAAKAKREEEQNKR